MAYRIERLSETTGKWVKTVHTPVEWRASFADVMAVVRHLQKENENAQFRVVSQVRLSSGRLRETVVFPEVEE